ncbi:MAG: protein translocase subunit SecDF [Flavobacteriales bacterium]|nr:protein translocase subunit SecDF [Flavobacteriales bacterium]
MQNKGPIRLFLVVLAVVSVYQLFFTWKSKSVEEQAYEYAVSKAEGDTFATNAAKDSAVKKIQKYYFDSIATVPVINIGVGSWRPIQYTYTDVKNNELNLGLDLQGGVSTILEVSVADVIKGLAGNTTDPTFNKALASAKKISPANEDLLTTFFREFERIKEEDGTDVKLSSPELFGTSSMLSKMKTGTEDEMKKLIRTEVEGAVDRAFEILRARIDKFGVASPTIQRLPGTDQISIELAGVSDADRVRKLLQSSAALEFWTVYTPKEIIPFFMAANNRLKEMQALVVSSEKTETATVKDSTAAPVSEIDSLKNAAESLIKQLDEKEVSQDASSEQFKSENPLFAVLSPVQQMSPVVAYVSVKDTATVNKYLAMPEIQELLINSGLQYTEFLWSNKPIETDATLMELYAIRSNRTATPELSGDVIDDAFQSYDQRSRPSVSMSMDATGAAKWEKMTEERIADADGNRFIAIVLDKSVYSAPGVQSVISGGRSEISGNFDVKEAKDLANILKAGKLPAPARIVQSEIVGPSLGQESINAGMISFAIAFVIVLAWMFFYYAKSGLYADIAIFVNVLFIFGILASLGATLTMPGIAGIILTIGMAVDANVIINERIKEELRAGKTDKQAVKDGYGNAYSSIIDANVTTFLTCLLLFIFGKGPIQGFATTMMIGIATSLLTAIFVSRLFIEADLKHGRKLKVATGAVKNWFMNTNFQFIAKKNKFYILSSVLIVASILAMAVRGFDKSIDFVGGRTYTIRFDQPVSTEEVAAALGEVLVEDGDNLIPEVKTYGSASQVKISTKYMSNKTGEGIDGMVDQKIYEGVKKFYPNGLSYTEFTSGEGLGIMEANVVGPTMAEDIKMSTVYALSLAIIAIFLYILMRFRRWQYSAGMIAASIHNVIIVCGVFALFHGILPFSLQIDQTFVAAILTVIGYALNDNVVVFDRIREEIHLNPRKDIDFVANMSINKTLGRTINTSFSTFLVILIVFLFGGDSIRGFMLAMGIGVIVGTYSSIFIATPVMLDLTKRQLAKQAQQEEKK